MPRSRGWRPICGPPAPSSRPGPISKPKWRRSARRRPHHEHRVRSDAIMTSFTLNGRDISVDVAEDTPLLWVIRDEIGLKGTKFGCGIGMCGACTVHVEGRALRSCITPLEAVAGAKVTTI